MAHTKTRDASFLECQDLFETLAIDHEFQFHVGRTLFEHPLHLFRAEVTGAQHGDAAALGHLAKDQGALLVKDADITAHKKASAAFFACLEQLHQFDLDVLKLAAHHFGQVELGLDVHRTTAQHVAYFKLLDRGGGIARRGAGAAAETDRILDPVFGQIQVTGTHDEAAHLIAGAKLAALVNLLFRHERARQMVVNQAGQFAVFHSFSYKGSMLIRIFLIALVGLIAPAAEPITHEKMWRLKRVGAPVASPDGRLVVFAMTVPAYEAREQSTDLWVVAGDGSAPARQLTYTRAAESNPVWSPDGKRIAFTTTREGDSAAQLYVMELTGGGEAQRYTSLKSGVAEPRWSPDGRRLLFTSMVQEGGVRSEKSNARVYENFPVRYWDRWLDGRRAHLFVMEARPGAEPLDLLAGTKWAKAAGMGGPLSSDGEDLAAEWTPDSQSIVFQSDINRDEAARGVVKTKIFLVPATGGEPQPLTAGAYSYGSPRFRPDGKALYVVESREGVDNATYSLNRLAMIAWPSGGVPKTVTEKVDRSVDSFVFSADSKQIYLTADAGGLGRLYRMAAEGGEAEEMPQTNGNFANLSRGGGALFANFESASRPAEIHRVEFAGKSHRQLTQFNEEALAELELSPLRHFYFTSKKGRTIHNLLVTPPGFDASKKYPLLVLIHGGPHSMWKDQFVLRWNYHLLASPGYVVLLTNYTGSTGFGESFARKIQLDPLATPGEELNEAADEALRVFPFIDPARQAAGGASYGGHLANWLQATTTRYKCLVSHAGLVNLESQWGTSDSIYSREINNGGPVWEQGEVWRKQNPVRYAAKFKTPVLVTVGERDYRVPLNNSLEYWAVLQRLRIPSKLIVFPDANHWILKGEDSRFFYTQVIDWLARWLK